MAVVWFSILRTLVLFATLQFKALATPQKTNSLENLSSQAYHSYWMELEKYRQEQFRNESNSLEKSWHEYQKEYNRSKNRGRHKKIIALNKAITQYRGYLNSNSSSNNFPYAYLNLANLLFEKATLTDGIEDKTEKIYRIEAAERLEEFTVKFPEHHLIDQALYLKALIYRSLGKEKTAFKTWMQLSTLTQGRIYGLRALLAIGDNYFQNEDADKAQIYYEKAMKLLKKSDKINNKEAEKLHIQYRIMWGAYRSARLPKTIKYGLEILKPGRISNNLNWFEQVTQDAIELVGDALYENNDRMYTTATLTRQEIKNSAVQIGLRLMYRYNVAEVSPEVAVIGKFISDHYPLAKHIPEVLAQTAEAYKKTNQKERGIELLEKLALFLPKSSLWRQKHARDHVLTAKMEKLAFGANLIVAKYYYEQGLAKANPANFAAARAFYQQLIEAKPTAKEVMRWRINVGHCYYFAEDYVAANRVYTDIKETFRSPSSILEVASFQLVLTREKLWRMRHAQAVIRKERSENNSKAMAALKLLDVAAESYANRFPDRIRSVDALLIAAAANRDHHQQTRAEQFWQRVLVSQSTPTQRSVAIRGILGIKIQNGKPQEVLKLSKRFLRLENWSQLGMTLDSELHGILATAGKESSQALYAQGQVAAAGQLLVDLVQEFPKIPKGDNLWRDGAYMLAIADKWQQARESAQKYLAIGKERKKADMLYLEARGLEYQLNFSEAAKGYIKLAQNHPKHSRALVSLRRAEKLSVFDDNHSIAGQAATILATRQRIRGKRIAAYKRAIEYYESAEEFNTASSLGRKLLKNSRNLNDKLYAQIAIARNSYKSGQEISALELYRKAGQLAFKSKQKLNHDTFSRLAGEAYLQLGLEANAKFDDFKILERQGSIINNLQVKTKYFSELVREHEKSIQTNHAEWSTQSRYLIGKAAENFAEELNFILVGANKKLTTAQTLKLRKTANRLQKISKKYWSANILARNNEPKKYAQSAWIKKSQVKLSGYSKSSIDPQLHSQLPHAMSHQIPQIWRAR